MTSPTSSASSTPEQRLVELGITIPPAGPPAGLFQGGVITGKLLFLSGTGPLKPEGGFVTGKVGGTVSLEEAREASRLCGLQLLHNIKAEVGSLDRVVRVVKLLGMVNCAPGFNNTPAVIDGCSQLMLEIFGEAGRSARSAVGMSELPFDICVEIEAIVELQ